MKKAYSNRIISVLLTFIITLSFIFRVRIYPGKNINADELEVFVVMQLKQFIDNLDFDVYAKEIADRVNSASPDLASEKAELSELTKKINNGVKAVMDGMDIPELKDEIDCLRVRKDELVDIINHSEENTEKNRP